MNRKLSAPQPLLAEHDVASFSCGRLELDDELKRRALINHNSGTSRVFVTTDDTGRVYATMPSRLEPLPMSMQPATFVEICRIQFRWLCLAG
ncbi:hypothetical protein [Paraburkholderia sp. 32]|uniref:hypothetical protein n=1 Tax=Paraburkholderia sp. 32 TaxID=2991057 RepID=UPI003D1C5FCD